MWTTQAIIDWLATLGIGRGGVVDVPVYPGPYLKEMPDLQAVVTTISGPGESMDGLADTPGFQLRFQGNQNSTRSPEDVALRADRLIMRAPLPTEAAPGVWLMPVTRSGGRPAPLAIDDNGDRIAFTCTYLTPVIEQGSDS